MDGLLAAHADSLKHLKICNLQVISEEQTSFDGFYSCFQKRLDLQTITLLGIWFIHNGDEEATTMLVTDMGEPCVKDLQRWIVSKSDAPMADLTPKVVLMDRDDGDYDSGPDESD
jgi:hypothetical protein